MNPLYQAIFRQARPYLLTRKNLLHTRIALKYGLKLLEKEGGDEEIVIPAILLHDVGWKAIPQSLHLKAFGPNASEPGLMKIHEREGAKIARAILEELDYPPEKTEEICRIIRGHDSRKRAFSLNDRIVRDADKLWRFSPKGVAIDSERFGIPKKAWIAYLKEKIEEWFFTASAKEMARGEIARQIPARSSGQGRSLPKPKPLRGR